MSAMWPMPDPRRHYTVEEFASLPMDRAHRYELEEGRVIVSPRPARRHMLLIGDLHAQIRWQLPKSMLVFPEIDVDLHLSPPVVRIPDLCITQADVLDLPGFTPAAKVLVAIEILSPGSFHTDTVVKPMEYADAGIPYYWLIDPQPPVTATLYTLVGENYEESLRGEKTFDIDAPCPLRIDLDALTP
ncbi:Uma2 family endonuclease [Actinokineospora sp.]|uniref:Uma2 family endonuclease n=1 Tax=Actinokineospora sp. TaxID=1872133 RepID=UPI003D6C4456